MKDYLKLLKGKLIKSQEGKEQKEQENKNLPKVTFENLELQIEIGRWLGVLNTSRCTGNKDFKIYYHLDTTEIIKEKLFTTEELDKINLEFGRFLRLVGVEASETCIIKDYNKKDFSFKCHFNKADDDAVISLRYGSFMDDSPEFTIDYKDVIKNYEYYGISKDNNFKLQLQYFTIKNSKNGNSCKRYLSPYNFYIDGYRNEYEASLSISEPWSSRRNHPKENIYMFNNEEELQSLFLNLEYPCDLNNLFNSICTILGISKQDLIIYEKFKLKIVKKTKKNKEKITDEILIENGVLKTLTITKDGITISYSEDGTMECEINNYYVGMDINKMIKDFSDNEILDLLTPYQKKVLKRLN